MAAPQKLGGGTGRLADAPIPSPRPAPLPIDDPALEHLPDGVRFAVSLESNAAAIDGTAPIEEANVMYDIGDGAYFPPNARLGFANRGGVDTAAGTVAFWIQPVDWDGSDATTRSFFHLHDPATTGYRFHILKDGHELRLEFVTDQADRVNLYAPITDWKRGEWHHVAVAWSDGQVALYVDGVRIAEAPFRGTLDVASNAPAWWGSTWPSGVEGAGAALRRGVVADGALSDEEIAALARDEG